MIHAARLPRPSAGSFLNYRIEVEITEELGDLELEVLTERDKEDPTPGDGD